MSENKADIIPIKRAEARQFVNTLFPNATPEASKLISDVLGITLSTQKKDAPT